MSPLYILQGTIITGKKRGKSLGFPTANIKLDEKIPEGIYAAKVLIDGKEYLAATFIGAAKTFNESELKAESYILDFSKNIYGKNITIKLYNKVRGNKKFESEEELVAQMEKDLERIKLFFEENG